MWNSEITNSIEHKHQRDKNKCKYGEDGEGWRRLKRIANILAYLKSSDAFAVEEDCRADAEDGDGALAGLSSSLRTVLNTLLFFGEGLFQSLLYKDFLDPWKYDNVAANIHVNTLYTIGNRLHVRLDFQLYVM